MLQLLMRRTVKLTLGGTAAFVAYNCFKDMGPPESAVGFLAHRPQRNVRQMLQEKIARSTGMYFTNPGVHNLKVVNVAYPWSFFDSKFPDWLLKLKKEQDFPKCALAADFKRAMSVGDLEGINNLLMEDPTILTKEDSYGETVLFYTLYQDVISVALIKLLILQGANPHHQNKDGETFISKLEAAGHSELAGELCRNTGRKCHNKDI